MKEKYSRIKPYKKFLIRCIPLYVLTFIVMLISSCSFGLYAEYVKDAKTVAMNNMVYAEVDEILQRSNGTSHGYSNNWDIYYTYEDNGFKYIGFIIVAGEEKAKSYLGKKIPIYIDGEGHCIAVGQYAGNELTQKQLTRGIVCLIIFIILLLIAIYLFLQQRKKIKASNSQEMKI